MREVVRKKKRYKRSFLLRISVVCLGVYILAALIDQQMQISQKREQLAQLQQEIQILNAIKKGFPAKKAAAGATAEFFNTDVGIPA